MSTFFQAQNKGKEYSLDLAQAFSKEKQRMMLLESQLG